MDVSAAAALIDSETSTVGQVMSNRSIVELPLNGRNYLQLAKLTAGVTTARGTRGEGQGVFSSAGQHGTQTSYSLDGVDNKARMTGGPVGTEAQMVTPSIDSIAEFKVVTNNNSAEYGFRTGGTVIISTKGGTNQLHGVAVRVPPQRQGGRDELLFGRQTEAAVPAERVRRNRRRAGVQEPNVLLREL